MGLNIDQPDEKFTPEDLKFTVSIITNVNPAYVAYPFFQGMILRNSSETHLQNNSFIQHYDQ